MPTPNPLEQTAASLAPGSQFIELFTIDLTDLGGPVWNITPGPIGANLVSFNGTFYVPVPFEAQGFEYSGQGPLPTPTLKVSNVNNYGMGLLITYKDMLGATVIRRRTYAKFLDGKPDADGTMAGTPDIFRVERKGPCDKTYITIELASPLDLQGRMIPYGVVLRDVCRFKYRTWNGSGFNYFTCPYAGAVYADISDNFVTDPSADVCSHRLTGCDKRYNPSNYGGGPDTANPLPFDGFPGSQVGQFAG